MTEKINFVTTNSYKFEVAKRFFKALPENRFDLVQYDMETPEIQDESEEEIARQSALWVSRQLGEVAVSSDVGFHIESLGGFPGPFVKYTNKWLRPDDVLNMMKPYSDKSAYFVDVLAIASPDGESHTFTSTTQGTIIDTDTVPDIKWTTDALFIPDGHSKPLASMDDSEQDTVWSNEAWDQLAKHLIERDRDA